jgi:hypothetical protein
LFDLALFFEMASRLGFLGFCMNFRNQHYAKPKYPLFLSDSCSFDTVIIFVTSSVLWGSIASH